jgi:hypothetical protein
MTNTLDTPAGDPVTERRLTPTERLHQALMSSLERPVKTAEPAFTVAREKGQASGPAASPTVWTFTGHVPRCDEYPTAELAFEASIDYARRFEAAFPTPAAAGPPDEPTARKAAAIHANRAKAKP